MGTTNYLLLHTDKVFTQVRRKLNRTRVKVLVEVGASTKLGKTKYPYQSLFNNTVPVYTWKTQQIY